MFVDITVLAGGRADLPTPNDRDDIAVRLFLRLLCAKTSTATLNNYTTALSRAFWLANTFTTHLLSSASQRLY